MKTNTSNPPFPNKLATRSNIQYQYIPPLFMLCLCFLLSVGTSHAQWVQVGSNLNGVGEEDWFGYNLAFSADGTRLAVSASQNWHLHSDPGYVIVYQYNSGEWDTVGDTIYGATPTDNSGISIELSHDGSRVAIGTVFNDSNGTSAGHVRIFDEIAGDWEPVGYPIEGEAAYDYFGTSVSLDSSGNRIAIGGDGNDGNGNHSGHIRIFDFDESENEWKQVGEAIEGEAEWDRSQEVSLSADGARVAIGAADNDGNGPNSGHVRVYEYDNATWAKLGQDIDGKEAYNTIDLIIGVSLSSDGTRVAIGSNGNDGNGTDAGHVRVYEYSEDGDSWNQIGSDLEGEAAYDQSGFEINLNSNGTRLAVGAMNNDGNGSNSGHVRIYDDIDGEWIQYGGDLDGEASGDNFGRSLVLSQDGKRLAIGARYNDVIAFDAGQVKVFDDLGCLNTTILISDDFETGFGNWNDGGNDCDRVTQHANSGTYSVRVRDNSGVNSSIYTNILDMEGVSYATIRFSYYALSMESGKDFFLEVSTDGGSSYDIYKTWVSGENFRNGTRVNESVSVNIAFSDSTRFRIRSDGQSNNDRVYFDDIVIIACNLDGCPVTGQPCEDGDPCTTGEIFTEDCECTGGVYVDIDLDGYCIGEDPDDNDPCVPDPGSPECDNPADTMVVDAITMNRRSAGRNWYVTARITVLDEFGIGVDGASVSVSWSGPKSANNSGVTDNQGIVSFNSPKTRADGCFEINVNAVTKAGWTWDSANSQLTDQICNPPQSSSLAREYYQDHRPGMPMKIYPNPFSDRMDIHYEITEAGPVLIEIFHINGQKIRTLSSDVLQPGLYSDHWDGLDSGGSAVFNGLYIVRLQTNERIENQRVCLLR